MPHFFNPRQQYHISTSFKVLNTLLHHQPSLQRVVPNANMIGGNVLKRFLPFWGMPHFLLVRDPYKRTVSFYKDKFLKTPSLVSYTYDELQRCQKLFCPYLEIKQHDSPEVIREKLLSLSFAQFVELLPSVYHLDGHLHPQVMTQKIEYQGRRVILLRMNRVLKIEEPETFVFLHSKLGLDVSHKHNSTEDVSFADPWSPALRAVINQLYKADFEEYGYELYPTSS